MDILLRRCEVRDLFKIVEILRDSWDLYAVFYFRVIILGFFFYGITLFFGGNGE